MRRSWRVRIAIAVTAVAVALAISLGWAEFCFAQDQAKDAALAQDQAVKSKPKKKRPAKPQAVNLYQSSFDPTTPPSPEAQLKNSFKIPPMQGAADQRGPGLRYEIGEKLRLSPGAAPAPDGSRAGVGGGGVRAMWQSKGNVAVSGGVGYDSEGRANAGAPSSAGPSEAGSPGPSAGVVLKYSF